MQLFAWIGNQDIEAARLKDVHRGSISEAAITGRFTRLWVLDNYNNTDTRDYGPWLESICEADVQHMPVNLESTADLAAIYRAAEQAIERALSEGAVREDLVFHIGPGTSTMSATWILLAANYGARMIRSTAADGIIDVPLPFDVASELRVAPRIQRSAAGEVVNYEAFSGLQFHSVEMREVIRLAQRAAQFPAPYPILLEGPSGSGKEILAKAIHEASPRHNGPMIAVNCGAIPSELIEAELFGARKGSFTGASQDRIGRFEAAHRGTIFLDEIGEMSLAAQVRLLRVLQEREVTPVGDSRPRKVDVRVIAATHRDLPKAVASGNFREDLMYRLMVFHLKVPALKERKGDLNPLINFFLDQINADLKNLPGSPPKVLTPGARKVLLRHDWPGNVRELGSTIARCALAAYDEEFITEDIARREILVRIEAREDVLGRPIGNGFQLRQVMAHVADHYIHRAMDDTNNVKSKAAALLGLNSAQVLTKWMTKYSR